jgi:hypothetical protein
MVCSAVVLVMAMCEVVSGAEDVRQAEGKEARQSCEAVLIGSLKQGHLEAQHYSPELLRDIVVACNPNAILVELPADRESAYSAVDVQTITRTPSLTADIHAAAQAATWLGVKLVGIDVPDKQVYLEQIRYDERRDRAIQKTQEWMDRVSEQQALNRVDLGIAKVAAHLAHSLSSFRSPRTVNSPGFDAVMRDKYFLRFEMLPEILRKYDGFETAAEEWEFLADEWSKRNRIMAGNIREAVRRHVGRRIVIIVSADHCYILRDFLRAQRGVTLRDYWEILPTDAEDTDTVYKQCEVHGERTDRPSKVGGNAMRMQEHQKMMDLSVPAIPDGAFTLRNFNGSVNVQTGEDGKCGIEALIRAKATTEARAKELVEKTRIESETESGGVTVRVVRPPTGGDESAAVDFDIVLPRQTDLEVTTRNGNVVVSGIMGRQQCRSSNGSIECHQVSSWTELVTDNGSISLRCPTRMAAQCQVRAATHNGNIFLEGVANLSAVIEAKTCNGAVLCQSPITTECTSGTELKGRIGQAEGRVLLETFNGTVTVR